jgi:mannose-6-phosphate isomerase
MADESIIPAEEAADVVARLKRRMIEDAIPL